MRGCKTTNRLLDGDLVGMRRKALCLFCGNSISTHEDNRHSIMGSHQRIYTRFTNYLAIDAHFPDSAWIICMRKHRMFCSNRTVITHKAHAVEAGIQPFHHVQWFMLSSNQCSQAKQVLRMQVAHIMM